MFIYHICYLRVLRVCLLMVRQLQSSRIFLWTPGSGGLPRGRSAAATSRHLEAETGATAARCSDVAAAVVTPSSGEKALDRLA